MAEVERKRGGSPSTSVYKLDHIWQGKAGVMGPIYEMIIGCGQCGRSWSKFRDRSDAERCGFLGCEHSSFAFARPLSFTAGLNFDLMGQMCM